MSSRFTELAIDCADPESLAQFWCAVLDYEVQESGDGLVSLGPRLEAEGASRPGPCRRR
ncbi:VOC family protein [Zhihengliuella halotolerans]|uniref:VOC family protein n=1 Tax=Zhihengliuella halotolerans TaxID=370736 RepID=UPI0027E40A4E|nr:VOC family protein [Zhihengliuella halotolerans]